MYLIFFLMWKLSAYRKFFASKLQGGQPSVSKLPAFVKRLKLTKAANYFVSFSIKKWNKSSLAETTSKHYHSKKCYSIAILDLFCDADVII